MTTLEESWCRGNKRAHLFDDQILSDSAMNELKARYFTDREYLPYSVNSGLLIDYGDLEVY